ncbi:MAG: endolytic transglycosylase MltG [bacterium]
MKFYLSVVAKILAAGIVLTLFLTLIIGLLIYNWYTTSINTVIDPNSDPIKFAVSEGWSFYRTSLELEKLGLVKDRRVLKLFAYFNRDRASVKAGEYWLSGNMTPLEILNKLYIGDVITYSITFPEGLSIKEMAAKWEASGFGTAFDFLDAVDHYHDLDISLPTTGWEGYLFPDTYIFTRNFSEDKLITKMITEMKQVIRPEWRASAAEKGLNLHQLITLASLIEKETRLSSERFLISSVFHNRLVKGMPLQCDPTVIYALGDRYTGTLLKTHLALDHPYNTYVYVGLPPGPIAAPGKDSLEAACYPADTQFLYFVADAQGGHSFSETLAEHNRAVQRYRNWIRLNKGSMN